MSALSEMLTEANGGRMSARSLARSAQAAGYSLNHDTAARYLRGDHGRPDETTLLALSKVLRIPLGRLRAAAALPSDSTEPYRPPAESSRLSRRQRRAVDEIIRAMLDQPISSKDEVGRRRAQRNGVGPRAELGGSRAGEKASAARPVKAPARAARRGSAESV